MAHDNRGTPKTLEEAIEFAICVGEARGAKERLYVHVKDFLSQRFGVAMLQAEHEEAKRLEDLFKLIVKRGD